MKNYLINKISKIVLIAMILGVSSCKKDYTNPGAATSASVLSSVNGLTGVAIGLQNWYTAGRGGLVYNTETASGLLTNEIYVVNSGNQDEAQLATGGASVQNTNGIGIGICTDSDLCGGESPAGEIVIAIAVCPTAEPCCCRARPTV